MERCLEREIKGGEQLPSPFSEDPTASHNSTTSNRKRRAQSPYLDYQPSHERTKYNGTNTSLQNENSSNQHKVTSSPKPSKVFVEERVTRKRQAESDYEGNRKRHRRQFSEEEHGSVASWLESLPASTQEFKEMSQPPNKRSRTQSQSGSNEIPSSDTETDTTVSREKMYATYEDPRYESVLASKNS